MGDIYRSEISNIKSVTMVSDGLFAVSRALSTGINEGVEYGVSIYKPMGLSYSSSVAEIAKYDFPNATDPFPGMAMAVLSGKYYHLVGSGAGGSTWKLYSTDSIGNVTFICNGPANTSVTSNKGVALFIKSGTMYAAVLGATGTSGATGHMLLGRFDLTANTFIVMVNQPISSAATWSGSLIAAAFSGGIALFRNNNAAVYMDSFDGTTYTESTTPLSLPTSSAVMLTGTTNHRVTSDGVDIYMSYHSYYHNVLTKISGTFASKTITKIGEVTAPGNSLYGSMAPMVNHIGKLYMLVVPVAYASPSYVQNLKYPMQLYRIKPTGIECILTLDYSSVKMADFVPIASGKLCILEITADNPNSGASQRSSAIIVEVPYALL
jgi:hypothetical protein